MSSLPTNEKLMAHTNSIPYMVGLSFYTTGEITYWPNTIYVKYKTFGSLHSFLLKNEFSPLNSPSCSTQCRCKVNNAKRIQVYI